MSLIRVDPARCAGDGLCVSACPAGLLRLEAGVPVAEAGARDVCIRCGHCVAVCPTGALVNEVLPEEEFSLIDRGLLPGPEATEALLASRRSVRSFKDEAVPRETLERLLETARRAPTASNTQKVSWIMVQDPERLAGIVRETTAWMRTVPGRERYVALADTGRDMVLRGAPVLAVAHAPQDWAWLDVDCAIALTAMELAAFSLGLGACWAGLMTAASKAVPALRELIELPQGHRVGCALMLGRPAYRHRLVPPRNPVNASWL